MRVRTVITSGDMRDVRAGRRRGGREVELAVKVYVHRVRREVGVLLAASLDAVVFTGGVAEHNPDLFAGFGLFGVRVVRRLLAAGGDRVVSPLGVLPRMFPDVPAGTEGQGARAAAGPVAVMAAREELELAGQAEAVVGRALCGVKS
jgi:acetate kinase